MTLAVLLVPKGLGVIYRDTEDPPEEFTLSWLRHAMTPVSELGPAARLALLPHAVELMAVFERAVE